MTEFEKATPRPWSGADDATPRELWSGDGNALLAEFFDTSEGLEGDDAAADANARLSLRAVNSFDAMVALAEKAAEDIDYDDHNEMLIDREELYQLAVAALKTMKGA